MIYLHNWFYPAHQADYQPGSVFTDTIVAVGVSVLSIIAANAFDRDSPGLATLLRCVPIAASLYWIFKRFFPNENGNGHHHYVVGYPEVAPLPQQRHHRHYGNFWNWLKPARTHPAPVHPRHVYYRDPPQRNFPYVTPAPAQPYAPKPLNVDRVTPRPFPAVWRTPAQPNHRQMNGGPVAARPFPAVWRTPAQPNHRPMYEVPGYGTQHSNNHPGNERVMFPAAKS